MARTKMNIYTCTYLYMNMNIHVYIYTQAEDRVKEFGHGTYLDKYIHTYVCVYVYPCIHIHDG